MRNRARIEMLFCIAILATATTAADVTMRHNSGGKAMGFDASGETVTYIQGLKMRTESNARGNQSIIILDLEAQQLISLDAKKKRAEVTNLAEMARQLRAITSGDVSVRMSATGRSRTIAGQECQEYDLSIRIAASPVPDQPIQIVMQGPAWLAADAPGKDEVVRFYTTAAERGLFFGDPRVVQGQPGQAKGLVELYRAMAEKGVPYAMEMQISFEGSGMIAQMMNRMGKSNITSTLISISTESLNGDLFEIPADYKVKRN